jgi:phosphomannomutase
VRRPRRWFNNSAGHHAALLRACRVQGISRVGYTLPTHPVFHGFLGVVRQSLGQDWQPLRVARDGDGLRLDWSDRWVQVRASNTEPIIRIIAEAPETKDAVKLIDESMKVVAEAVKPFMP